MLNTANSTLDARGLNCPLPILKTRKQLNLMNPGEVLLMQASDPGSVKDIEAFCRQTGNELVESGSSNGEFNFMIRKV